MSAQSSSSSFLHVLKCILYELQPFRIVDVIDLTKYIIVSTKDLGVAGVTFSDFAYQSTFYWISSFTRQTWVYIILWLAALASMNYAGFGSLWILISMFASIFLNLGTRKQGEMSAYSVFNHGFQQLLGTMNAEQFDNEIRHNAFQREDAQDGGFVRFDDAFEGESGSEDEDFAQQRNHRLRARHNQRVARAAAAQELLHNNVNGVIGANGVNVGNNANGAGEAERGAVQAPALVRRKGKKGRRNYEERLVRREAAALQRQQLEDMGGEFEFDDEFVGDEN